MESKGLTDDGNESGCGDFDVAGEPRCLILLLTVVVGAGTEAGDAGAEGDAVVDFRAAAFLSFPAYFFKYGLLGSPPSLLSADKRHMAVDWKQRTDCWLKLLRT